MQIKDRSNQTNNRVIEETKIVLMATLDEDIYENDLDLDYMKPTSSPGSDHTYEKGLELKKKNEKFAPVSMANEEASKN